MNWNTATAARAGPASGTAIRKKSCISEAPSMAADSNSSSGTFAKKLRSR
jgi:hypothetical protein